MKVYVVQGAEPAWDNEHTWIAKVFRDKDQAEQFAHDAQVYAKDHSEGGPDPNFERWGKWNTTVTYDVTEAELV